MAAPPGSTAYSRVSDRRFGAENQTVAEKLAGDSDGCGQGPARVVAKIEDQAIGAVGQQRDQRIMDLVGAVVGELGQSDEPDTGFDHLRDDHRHDHRRPGDNDIDDPAVA